MLSVIIPSRDPRFLQKTVDDLLAKAEGAIEIIIVLDGYWPKPIIKSHPKVLVIHHGTVHNHKGMRESINLGVRVASGDYIMKIDEHCMMDQGYDLKLIADCEDDWVIVPRRYRLDPEKWEVIKDGRPPIDYMYIEYPYLKPLDITQGLHGNEWRQKYHANKHIEVDDIPSTQGSCYFMKKSWWEKLGEMESENYGTFTHEAQEITLKTWLMGGRCVVNKKTWYAHLHKGRKYGTGYGFSTDQWKRHSESMEKGRLFCINYWLYCKNYKYDWDWFIKKFPDMPGWSADWRERVERDRLNDYSTLNYQDSEWLEGLRK